MITLSDINSLTNSHDGSIYSDLYKDVYGSRPSGKTNFDSLEAFDEEMNFLSKCVDRMIDEERTEKKLAWVRFLNRIEQTCELVSNANVRRAIEIIADAEGISAEDRSFYGWESLEWKLGLEYGSIEAFLLVKGV